MKIGKGYGVDYVNELYNQVKDFAHLQCFTDDSDNVNSNVEIINTTSWVPERLWWNKVLLFKPGLFKEPTLYVDLDSFISDDCSHLLNYYNPNKLTLLKTYWFSKDTREKIHMCDVNSSVMILGGDNGAKLYEEFINNKKKLYTSFYGLDSWIFRRQRNNVEYFKPGLVYSYRYGNQYPDDVEEFKIRKIPIVVLDDIAEKDKAISQIWKARNENKST